MTAEDQDAQVGRIVRERRDLRAQREAVVAKGQSLGRLLGGIGKAMTVRAPGGPYPNRDHSLSIDDDGLVRVSDEYTTQSILSGKFPTHEELSSIIREAKALERRLMELDTQLKAFGV